MNDLLDDYLYVLARAATLFRDAAREHPELVPCRPRCIECCVGLFEITLLDAAVLGRACECLPDTVRNFLRERALTQLDSLHTFDPRLPKGSEYLKDKTERGLISLTGTVVVAQEPIKTWSLSFSRSSFNKLIKRAGNVRCPLLDDGDYCILYNFRPLVCRLQGLPHVSRACRKMKSVRPGRTISNAVARASVGRNRGPTEWEQKLEAEVRVISDMEFVLLERLGEKVGNRDAQFSVCFVATAVAQA